MNKEALTYLKSYSFNPLEVDRLIVSAFLQSNQIENVQNSVVNNLIIKKNDQDFQKLTEFLSIQIKIKSEDLIELFEFVISPAEKIVTGAVYTPNVIRDFIVDNTLSGAENYDGFKICDPACGCAGFLYTVAKKIKSNTNLSYADIFRNNIFGLDIQEYSVNRSKLLLSLLAIGTGEDQEIFEFNIYQGDALNFNWHEQIADFNGFQTILGNPPYVCSRNINVASKEYLKNWSVCTSGHPDLYIPFFEIGMTNLAQNGILGFITMNTFFKSVNGRALRKYFENSRFEFKIIDFGSLQIFNSKSTYTCICFIKNRLSDSVEYTKINTLDSLFSDDLIFNVIPYESLNPLNGWNLQEVDLIRKIESVGTPLGKRFKSRNGIATLKNDIYIFDPVDEDEDFYYLQNGKRFKIEKGICKDIINPNKLTRINEIGSLKKKLIFPYNRVDSTIKLMDEKEISNNFPEAFHYLSLKRDVLATRDRGKGKYEQWYAFGRNQSLEKLEHKLFFPHITPSIPNYVIDSDKNLFFYNGLAIIGENVEELKLLRKVMSSRLFWFYVKNSSKPYGSGYFSLSRNYIKSFGVPDFTDEENQYLLKEKNQNNIDQFLEAKYEINLNTL